MVLPPVYVPVKGDIMSSTYVSPVLDPLLGEIEGKWGTVSINAPIVLTSDSTLVPKLFVACILTLMRFPCDKSNGLA